jgi:hypothetical protein
MKYALTGLAGVIALGLVGLAPDTASAGYRGWGGGWGGPGFGIYVGPRYGYRSYGYGYGYRPITTIATRMGTARAGAIVTAIGINRPPLILAKRPPLLAA